MNIGSVGRGGNSDGKVVNIGDDEASGDIHLKASHIYNKEKGQDGGALRDPC